MNSRARVDAGVAPPSGTSLSEIVAGPRPGGLLAWLAAVLLTWAVVAALMAAGSPASPESGQLLSQAQWQSRPAAAAAATPATVPAEVLAGPWQTRALPLLQAKVEASQPGRLVTWLQWDLSDAAPGQKGLAFYLPRWQAQAQIALYADGHLLYRSRGNERWPAFNEPLWIPLDRQGTDAPPRTLQLRLEGPPGPMSISRAWVGPVEALAPLHRWRVRWQHDVNRVLSVVALVLGGIALSIWALHRRETLFLLFALFAAMWVLRGLRFHVGVESLPVPPAWFGWLSVNAGNALLLLWYLFVARLVPGTPRWLRTLLIALLLTTSIATLPWLAQVAPVAHIGWLGSAAYALTISVGMPTGLFLAWLAWRHGTLESALVAVACLAHMPVAIHDLLMQSCRLDPEGYYWWPISTVLRITLFAAIVVHRYHSAARAAESSQQRLAQRLQEQEDELSRSHAALRIVQERETIARERQRLMQDLHDGLGSQLISAQRMAESGTLSSPDMARLLKASIDDLKLTVDSMELVDPDLLLLLATLRHRLQPRLEASGIALHWQVQDVPPLPWLDEAAALNVLRILQEGIANVIQHAHAHNLTLATRMRDGGVEVRLQDDGIGALAERPGARRQGAGRHAAPRAGAAGSRQLAACARGGLRADLVAAAGPLGKPGLCCTALIVAWVAAQSTSAARSDGSPRWGSSQGCCAS